MIEKLVNDNYVYKARYDDEEIGGKIYSFDVEIEFVEKNYGTVEEDTKMVLAIDLDNIVRDNEKCLFNELENSEIFSIKEQCLVDAEKELKKYQYGE